MLNFFLETLRDEFRTRPATTLAVICISAFCYYAYTAHAKASDLVRVNYRLTTLEEKMSSRVQLVKLSIEQTRIEAKLGNDQRELWSIERTIEAFERAGENTPPVYLQRRDSLQIDIARSERLLAKTERAVEKANAEVQRFENRGTE